MHNAGRYMNGTTVRADLVPISITLMDDIAQSTLRESNRALEKQIDTIILDGKFARRIPIFDEVVTSSGAPIDRTSPTTTIAENYMFGEKSTNITDPLQCTIARGSTGNLTEFGRSQLVEANTAFDILKTQSQVEQLKIDTELLVSMRQPNCFPNSKPRLNSYW